MNHRKLSLLSLLLFVISAPALAVTPVPVFNIIKASQIPGVVLDCVVNPNVANVGKTASGGTCTDNTTAINSAVQSLVSTGAGSIKLILDGGTASTGIVVPSVGYFEIEGIGWNSGIFIIAGSNSHAIYNNGKTSPFDQQTTPPALGGYVRLSNFTINGNRGNGTTGNSNTGNPRGQSNYWYSNIDLANLNGVRIENMFSYDSPGYNMRINNCADIVVANNSIINPNTTTTANNDCIHIDGPYVDLRISKNKLSNNNSDDGIALNAHEGYGGPGTRAVITDNTYQNTATAIRIYGSSGTISAPVGTVIFSNNTGTVGFCVMLLGVSITYNQDIAGQVILASDNSFQVANGAFASIQGNVGELIFSNCVYNAPAVASPFISGAFAGSTISDLVLNDCAIYRNTTGNNTSTPLLSATAALTVKRMTINKFRVSDEAGQSYSAVASLLAMTNITIGSLYIPAFDYTNVAALADSYAGIGNLYGPGYPNRQAIAANKTGAYTVIQTDAYLRGDATTATFAFTLPAAPYLYEEHEFQKVDSSANAVTIAGNGKTINGTASLGTQWSHAKLRYNGTTWDSL